MRESPSFSDAVILTLALAIGANSAVFSAIDAILLRPLPFPEADQTVKLSQSDGTRPAPQPPSRPFGWKTGIVMPHEFQASRASIRRIRKDRELLPEKVTEALVSPRFLQVWGVAPVTRPRFHHPAEEHFGGPRAVLISDRFGGAGSSLIRPQSAEDLRLEGIRTPIVGVMPASFHFPDPDVDLWSAESAGRARCANPRVDMVHGLRRLKPGVTASSGARKFRQRPGSTGPRFPKTDADLAVRLQPLKETTVGGVRRSLWVLFGSVSLLLLIACTNIASLLLARTTQREREISVRFSLGASRASVIAQLLTECLVLALSGCALGLLIAGLGSKALRVLAQALPRAQEISLDWRIGLYTLAWTVLATLLCGLFPAIRGSRRISLAILRTPAAPRFPPIIHYSGCSSGYR